MHPRSQMVRDAEANLRNTIYQWRQSYKTLTELEQIMSIQHILSEEVHGYFKYKLRYERHPDNPDRPADLE